MRTATPIALLALLLAVDCIAQSTAGIAPYDANPSYWAIDGKPVLLLGGSVEDNLFQIPNIEEHLDLLAGCGGNYVRCTMSSRDDGDVWPFAQTENGQYDLDRWNDEYWNRFERFLALTAERGIVVQIEVWATFDFYRDIWARNPFNPKNNVNYTPETSGLPVNVPGHPLQLGNNWFWSIPAERNQEIVLGYQHRFVDRMLAASLQYGHVLYCMDNETAVTPEWGRYWSLYIREKAGERTVYTTEMWDPWNLQDPKHRNTYDHPEIYPFADISQNNHNKGEKHWNNMQWARGYIQPTRPINSIKIYGVDGGQFGSTQDGYERFWRNVVGGLASARFHRPGGGMGLSPGAQAHIRSARIATDAIDIVRCTPSNTLLSERGDNEAYCTADAGHAYAVD